MINLLVQRSLNLRHDLTRCLQWERFMGAVHYTFNRQFTSWQIENEEIRHASISYLPQERHFTLGNVSHPPKFENNKSFSLKAQALCRMSLQESMSYKGEGQNKNNGENSTRIDHLEAILVSLAGFFCRIMTILDIILDLLGINIFEEGTKRATEKLTVIITYYYL